MSRRASKSHPFTVEQMRLWAQEDIEREKKFTLAALRRAEAAEVKAHELSGKVEDLERLVVHLASRLGLKRQLTWSDSYWAEKLIRALDWLSNVEHEARLEDEFKVLLYGDEYRRSVGVTFDDEESEES